MNSNGDRLFSRVPFFTEWTENMQSGGAGLCRVIRAPDCEAVGIC